MASSPDSDLCQQVLECLPTGVFAADREGKVTFWNAGAERITGYLKQDVLGRQCNEGFLEHWDCEINTVVGSMVPLLVTLRSSSRRKPRMAGTMVARGRWRTRILLPR